MAEAEELTSNPWMNDKSPKDIDMNPKAATPNEVNDAEKKKRKDSKTNKKRKKEKRKQQSKKKKKKKKDKKKKHKKDKRQNDNSNIEKASELDAVEKEELKLPKRPKDEHAPKRPQTAYLLFQKHHIAEHKKKHGMTTKDIFKSASSEWKKLSAAQKEPFEAESRRAKQKYEKRFEKYQQTKEYTDYVATLDEWKKECDAIRAARKAASTSNATSSSTSRKRKRSSVSSAESRPAKKAKIDKRTNKVSVDEEEKEKEKESDMEMEMENECPKSLNGIENAATAANSSSNGVHSRQTEQMSSYFMRDRDPNLNYRKCQQNQPIECDAYDTDEELRKLHRIDQTYLACDSEEDCDMHRNTNGSVKSDTALVSEQPDDAKQDEQKQEEELDENGICDEWDFEDLMEHKAHVFHCKYRWNFCSTHFKHDNLEHIYQASFGSPTMQQLQKCENILNECIDTVNKYHREPMDEKLSAAFTDFANKYRIQFSDSILLFDGMTEGKEYTQEKGRSVRVGIFKKDQLASTSHANHDECNHNQREDSNANANNEDEWEMLLCYADNKQFVAESQQFFGLKIGDFQYESRKWALSEDPALTTTKGNVVLNQQWMDIGLVIGVSIINRLLNPASPDRHHKNSIFRQEIFDVTELLPPFDDLKSLLKNDGIWWYELQKRLEREEKAEGPPSEISSFGESMKDFIDDTALNEEEEQAAALSLENALRAADNDGEDHRNGHSTMMNVFLRELREYKEENDADYERDEQEDSSEDDDEDNECMEEEEVTQDLIELLSSDLRQQYEGNTNSKRTVAEIEDSERQQDAKADSEENTSATKKQRAHCNVD